MKCLVSSLGAVVAVLLSGCIHLVSYYDAQTYKNLTDLKGETKVFFDSCKREGAKGQDALNSLNGFVLASARAYEYEKGKALNDETIDQLRIIEESIMEVKVRYDGNRFEDQSCSGRPDGQAPNSSSGCLSTGYCLAKWGVLETAFDIAISTEQLKLKESE